MKPDRRRHRRRSPIDADHADLRPHPGRRSRAGRCPAVVAIEARDVAAPAVRDGIARLREEAVATGLMAEPITVRSSPNGRVALVSIPLAGTGTDDASVRALETLRDEVIPSTVGAVRRGGGDRPDRRVRGRERADGGADAAGDRLRARAGVRAPARRVPLGRDRGQGRAPEPALGRRRLRDARRRLPVGLGRGACSASSPPGAITAGLPLFMFVVLFGLSMDYHVFILSRVREAYDRGLPTDGRRGPRDPVHGRRRDGRGVRDGRRLLASSSRCRRRS